MKIAELFISLGFKIDGYKDFKDAEAGLTTAAISATKLTVAVNAVNLALLALVNQAMNAAVALGIFNQTTGVSTTELQRWQAAAKGAGIEVKNIDGAVKSLLDARNAFAFGEPQNVGAWSLLGVDPRQDPFVVLQNLRARVRDFADPNLMRGLLGKVGLDQIMPLLQLSDEDFARFRDSVVIPPEHIARLVALNKEWQKLSLGFTALKNQIAAALAPALTMLARALSVVVGWAIKAEQWLNSNATVARFLRGTLGVLTIALLAIGAALAGVAALFATAAGAVGLLGPAVATAAAALAPLLVTFGLLGILIAALVLIVDDLITGLQGGESVSGVFADWLLSFESVYHAIEAVIAIWDVLVDKLAKPLARFGGKAFDVLTNPISETWASALAAGGQDNKGAAWFTPRALATQGGNSNSRTENSVQVNVNGAASPEQTGRAVARSVKEELDSAAFQTPVPNL